MAKFMVRSRLTTKPTDQEIDAETRDEAVAKMVEGAPADQELEILQVKEMPAPAGGGGATGATGAASHAKK